MSRRTRLVRLNDMLVDMDAGPHGEISFSIVTQRFPSELRTTSTSLQPLAPCWLRTFSRSWIAAMNTRYLYIGWPLKWYDVVPYGHALDLLGEGHHDGAELSHGKRTHLHQFPVNVFGKETYN